MSVSIHAQVVSGLIGLAAIAAGVYLPQRLKRRNGRTRAVHERRDPGTPARDER